MKRVFAISFIIIFAFAIIGVGAFSFYTLMQFPDSELSMYILSLYMVVGTLLIISVFNIYKESGNNFFDPKLALKLLVSIPVLYFLACLDSNIISGLEFASSIPLILITCFTYQLLKFVSKLGKVDI